MHVFKNLVTTSPSDLEPWDAFPLKVVAVVGQANDWAAYRGFSDWTDQQVADGGDKLSEEAARALFWVLDVSGRTYRG